MIGVGGDPTEFGATFGISLIGIRLSSRRDKAAVNEFHGDTKIVCEPSGGIDETSLNLNATRVILKHCRQGSHHAKTTTPLTEGAARGEMRIVNGSQGMVNRHEVTRDKTTEMDATTVDKLLDALIRFTKKSGN